MMLLLPHPFSARDRGEQRTWTGQRVGTRGRGMQWWVNFMPHPWCNDYSWDAPMLGGVWTMLEGAPRQRAYNRGELVLRRHFVCFNSRQCLDKDKGGNCLLWCVRREEWRRVRFKLPPFLQDPFPPLKLASLSSFQMNHSPTQNVSFSSSLKTFPWST